MADVPVCSSLVSFSEKTMSENKMDEMERRSMQIIDLLTGSVLSALEAAGDKIELSMQTARIRQRFESVSDVLDMIANQKAGLQDRLANASGPLKLAIEAHIAALEIQEVNVLSRLGVQPSTAKQVIEKVDEQRATHRRDGKRFLPVVNGSE